MIIALLQAFDFLLPRWLFSASAGEILRKDLIRGRPPPCSIGTRWATAEDLVKLRLFNRHLCRLDDWIARGDRFAIAVRNGEIAGFENFRTRAYHLPEMPWVRICLAPNEIWSVSSYIAPQYRAQGVSRDILAFAAHQLREEGFAVMYDHIFEADGKAGSSHAKRGFAPIDRWRITRVLAVTLFHTGLIRRLGWWTVARPLSMMIKDISSPLPATRHLG